jgi:hypothetical protein
MIGHLGRIQSEETHGNFLSDMYFIAVLTFASNLGADPTLRILEKTFINFISSGESGNISVFTFGFDGSANVYTFTNDTGAFLLGCSKRILNLKSPEAHSIMIDPPSNTKSTLLTVTSPPLSATPAKLFALTGLPWTTSGIEFMHKNKIIAIQLTKLFI